MKKLSALIIVLNIASIANFFDSVFSKPAVNYFSAAIFTICAIITGIAIGMNISLFFDKNDKN